MKSIVIFGITGFSGNNIATEASKRGYSVLGVARHVKPGSKFKEIQGSIFDKTALQETITGQDWVVVALPAREIDGKKLVQALPELNMQAQKNGAKIAIVGGAGSLLVDKNGTRLMDTPDFPKEFLPEATAHAEVLKWMENNASVDWFYMSPAPMYGAAADIKVTGNYKIGNDDFLQETDLEVPSISGEDYAKAFVDELDKNEAINERISAIGMKSK